MGSDLRVGVDLIHVGRFEEALFRWPMLCRRVFTDDELSTCAPSNNLAERLAARFAAKEATFKALGEGWPLLSYHEVEVVTLDDAPTLRLSGRAAELAGRRVAAISLSHDGGMAMAGVVMSSTEEG